MWKRGKKDSSSERLWRFVFVSLWIYARHSNSRSQWNPFHFQFYPDMFEWRRTNAKTKPLNSDCEDSNVGMNLRWNVKYVTWSIINEWNRQNSRRHTKCINEALWFYAFEALAECMCVCVSAFCVSFWLLFKCGNGLVRFVCCRRKVKSEHRYPLQRHIHIQHFCECDEWRDEHIRSCCILCVCTLAAIFFSDSERFKGNIKTI